MDNSMCERCFKELDFVRHGDVSHILLSKNKRQCVRCGEVSQCVDDYVLFGANPGIDRMRKQNPRWKELKL